MHTWKNQWKCTQCDQTATPQDKGNLIQHALKNTKNRTQTHKKYQYKQVNKKITNARIRTLNETIPHGPINTYPIESKI